MLFLDALSYFSQVLRIFKKMILLVYHRIVSLNVQANSIQSPSFDSFRPWFHIYRYIKYAAFDDFWAMFISP